MEPFKLRRWKRAGSPERIPLFTCARPGRSQSKQDKVPNAIADKWVAGLPGDTKTAIVSLLGRKPDGTSEFSFYLFHGKDDSPDERARRPSFQQWLDERHLARDVQVIEHPTVDFKPVSAEVIAKVAADIDRFLGAQWTVVLVDSGGETRTKAVCTAIGFVEDSRSG